MPKQWLGQTVTLHTIKNQKPWHGSLQRLSGFINTQTRQRVLYVDVPAQKDLLPGVYLSVSIPGKQYDNILELPTTAITPQREIWWLDTNNNRLQKHRPEIVFEHSNKVFVSAPKHETIYVVIFPISRLWVNQHVQITMAQTPP